MNTVIKNEDKYKKAKIEYEQSCISMTALAKKYNFNRVSFGRYLKKQGIDTKKRADFETRKIYIKAKNDYINKNTETIKSICAKYNINTKNFSLYLKSENIEVRNGFKNKRYPKNENYFEVIDTEEKAYWLGFIYADGCVRYDTINRSYRLTIELSYIDENHLIKFLNCIKSNAPIYRRKNRETVSITINSKKIANDLVKLGAVEDKTNKGYISDSILNLNKELQLDFLRGYLDGDGFIDKNRARIVYTVKSKKIVNSLKEMLSEYNFKIKKDNSYYRLYIENKKNYYKFLNDIYKNANIYLDRKYDIFCKVYCRFKSKLQKA